MTASAETGSSSSLRQWTRTHRLLMSHFAHVVLFAVAWLLSFCLAYNFKVPDEFNWFTHYFLPLLPVVIVVKVAVFTIWGLDRGWWRYVSLRDLITIAWAAWVSFALIFFIMYTVVFNGRWFGIPQEWLGIDTDGWPDSVFPLDLGLTVALVGGARLAVRLYYEEVRPTVQGHVPRLLILGAGNAAENAVRELLRMPVLRYQVVGFLDDDPAKHGAQIHGLTVLGPLADVKRICEEEDVEELLIAMPSATKDRIRRVVNLCQGTNLKFKTLPAIEDLIAGRASVQEIREIDINDVLGREPVKLDAHQISAFLRDRVVMVTGAGGSIGSEMCRQIATFKPERLLLVEQAEGALFEIDRELRRTFPDLNCVPCVADIADRARMDALFACERPTAVIHAAAHKHVPMMEYNPGEAIKNNVDGTRVVADAAGRHGVEKFVMISTDKAVNPTSIMGASKRVAEMYIQGLNFRSATQYVTVRFGNVLGSSGSVIPIFKEQIARGGPVTVTHPDMVRYFMTIPEAAQLVLQAASMGAGGEIFVLDMGEPVKIVDLARNLITLSGFRPDEDIKIEFVGLRPGEKLFEELAIEGEDIARTPHPKIGIWQLKPVEWDGFVGLFEALIREANHLNREQMRDRIQCIVPEFQFESPAHKPPASTQSLSTQPAVLRQVPAA